MQQIFLDSSFRLTVTEARISYIKPIRAVRNDVMTFIHHSTLFFWSSAINSVTLAFFLLAMFPWIVHRRQGTSRVRALKIAFRWWAPRPQLRRSGKL